MSSPVIVETNALEVARALDLKGKRLSQVVKDIARDLGSQMLRDYERTVETWQDKPAFEQVVEISGDTVTALIGTDSLIYKFVDLGTRVRYATMSPDFAAKTKPGFLGSTAGRGGMVFVDKSKPKPGIQARRFTEIIQAKYDEVADQVAARYVMEWQSK